MPNLPHMRSFRETSESARSIWKSSEVRVSLFTLHDGNCLIVRNALRDELGAPSVEVKCLCHVSSPANVVGRPWLDEPR